MATASHVFDAVLYLNVGGVRFCTSRNTLTWCQDSFFTSLLSGRIPSLKDDTGAIFIDRDPELFKIILNYMRTKQVHLKDVDLVALRHEAQFYGLSPLVKRLTLCDEMKQCMCGDVLFHGYLPAPTLPSCDRLESIPSAENLTSAAVVMSHSRNLSEPCALPSYNRQLPPRPLPSMEAKFQLPSAAAVPQTMSTTSGPSTSAVAQAPLACMTPCGDVTATRPSYGHSRTGSADFKNGRGHYRNKGSADLTRQIRQDLNVVLRMQSAYSNTDLVRVRLIRGHHNWVAAGYAQFVCCYRMKDSIGWQLVFVSQRTDATVQHIALNAKFGNQSEKLLAAALSNRSVHLWGLTEEGSESKIGVFSLGSVSVDTLFFIGSQLVALSKQGKVGIWHSMTLNWQVQDVVPISSYDTAGSFLLLGCINGVIYYIDMQKFPLRMKDNDLLVTELYRDPSADVITSISVYLTPKTSLCGNWIEIAYGTRGGAVRVIVQHPETVGHGPQLFQTYAVHRAPITRVALTTNHLMSVCSEYNHVRSWQVTRFRGMISTQPGSTPLASFKVLTLESADYDGLDYDASDVGPYGDQDGEQVFIQKVVPDTNQLYVRLASTGDRVCVINSVDGCSITSFCVHECEGSSRMGSRPRRYLFTGHSNGCIQMFDLTTAFEMYQASKEKFVGTEYPQGPTPDELLCLVDECEITCNSLVGTPNSTPASSTLHLYAPSGARLSRQTSACDD